MDPETEESHGKGSGKAEIRMEEPDSYKLFLPTGPSPQTNVFISKIF